MYNYILQLLFAVMFLCFSAIMVVTTIMILHKDAKPKTPTLLRAIAGVIIGAFFQGIALVMAIDAWVRLRPGN